MQRRREGESGSLLPFMALVFLVAISAYMMATNVYAATTSKIRLERWGEDFLTGIYQEISYESYFFDEQPSTNFNNRDYVPVDCATLLRRISQSMGRFPQGVNLRSVSCQVGQMRLIITRKVELPFMPESLAGLQPEVVAYVAGGLQRLRANR